MRKCILAFLLCIPLTACKSEAEREREQRQQVQAKSSVAPDGSVHLTAEQISTNRIQTTAALEEFQTAETNLKQAQAKLEGTQRAKAEYDQTGAQESVQRRTPIRAPISGTIVAMSLIAGEQVDPTKSLMTIVDTSTVWAEVAVHESDLGQLRHAVNADIVIPFDPSRTYTGRLVNIGIAVDPQNRAVPMTFAVPNSDRTFKIEMAIEARIPAGPSQKMIVVPAAAILSEQGISSVFVESPPGVFQRRVVTVGQRKGGNAAIISGLAPGDKVVSLGAQ